MVRQATISDLKHIVSIMSSSLSDEEAQGLYFYLSMRIKDTAHYLILLDSFNELCMIVERIGNFKCQFHVYSKESSRGSHVLLFGKECAEWLFNNTAYTSFLSFVSSRHAAIFIRKIGLKPVGPIPCAGGEGVEEVLFSGTKECIMNKLNIKEVT